MSQLTVGIDIGTSSVKALAVDADGRVAARARVSHPFRVPEPDLLEHDAATAWWDGPVAALAELGGPARDAAGVGLSAMVPSCTAVDQTGRPQGVGLLYGDRRGRTAERGQSPAGNGEAEAFLAWQVDRHPG
ncbi:MAG: FGGY family carbohydrate kinase, partial [Mycobacteriales bacterium]